MNHRENTNFVTISSILQMISLGVIAFFSNAVLFEICFNFLNHKYALPFWSWYAATLMVSLGVLYACRYFSAKMKVSVSSEPVLHQFCLVLTIVALIVVLLLSFVGLLSLLLEGKLSVHKVALDLGRSILWILLVVYFVQDLLHAPKNPPLKQRSFHLLVGLGIVSLVYALVMLGR